MFSPLNLAVLMAVVGSSHVGISHMAAASVMIDRSHASLLVVTEDKAVSLQAWSAGTIRVEAAPGKVIPAKTSFAVVVPPVAEGWSVAEEPSRVVLKGPRMSAAVDKSTGLVTVWDAQGHTMLKQHEWSFRPAQERDRDGLEIKAAFVRDKDERFYGGGVTYDKLQHKVADIRLVNNNTEIRVPVLYSSRGYGVFWDNPSRGALRLRPGNVTWEASAGDVADFYVMAGPEADAVVAEYRNLTGAAPLFPEWAYGFWYSRNRFSSQKQILDAAKSFRDHAFPVDMLVQDYFYWKPDGSGGPAWEGWGSHQFVGDRYPDAKGMVDTLHDDFDIRFMTVIWPRFDVATANAKELDAVGGLLPHAGDRGWEQGTRFYDPFGAKAREIYCRQVMEQLLPLGVDAWWLDGCEPEINNHMMAKFDTAVGAASRVMDAYPLLHSEGVYRAQREATSDKRVVLLPRSAWAGMQRNAAANWTGDIHQDWAALKTQIDGLPNYSISGLPYITTDVGGYEPTPQADRELFVRWFEWGIFSPLFRVHGIARPFPWEYGAEGEVILKKFTNLRYRLLPYIYSQAADITFNSGTLMRPLVMDFRDDATALDVRDEFMFGPALLVCPVYESNRSSVATVEQIGDDQGHAASILAIYVDKEGGHTVARHELMDKSGLRYRDPNLTAEQRFAKSVTLSGTFTPDVSGRVALEVSESNPERSPVKATINGKQVGSSPLNGAWQFPLFHFEAKKGVPVRFSFESQMHPPTFRFVTEKKAPVGRDVYLPKAVGWYDFWTGQPHQGGKSMRIETPLDMIPLYVRAGSIIPMGPAVQHVGEQPDAPLELRVYRGADGFFSLYQDEGDNYNYEKGAHAETVIWWKQDTRTLTFGARKGSFPGMPETRTFHVVWVTAGHGVGEAPTAKVDAMVIYEGKEISIQAPSAF